MSSYNEFKKELLKNPEVKAEYDALEPEFNIIQKSELGNGKKTCQRARDAIEIGTCSTNQKGLISESVRKQ